MAVSGGIVERYKAGSPKVTMTTSAAVTAGQLVKLTADMTVAPAGAGDQAIGIALQTSDAALDLIACQLFGDVYDLVAAGAGIAAGTKVETGAAGTVAAVAAADPASLATVTAGINNTRATVGVALAAIADTATGPVMVIGA